VVHFLRGADPWQGIRPIPELLLYQFAFFHLFGLRLSYRSMTIAEENEKAEQLGPRFIQLLFSIACQ
jgi:hypothetical protein